jgi:hypothetical protein
MRELPNSLPMRSLVLPFLASLTASRSVCLVSAEERGEEPGEEEPMRGAGPPTCCSYQLIALKMIIQRELTYSVVGDGTMVTGYHTPIAQGTLVAALAIDRFATVAILGRVGGVVGFCAGTVSELCAF